MNNNTGRRNGISKAAGKTLFKIMDGGIARFDDAGVPGMPLVEAHAAATTKGGKWETYDRRKKEWKQQRRWARLYLR